MDPRLNPLRVDGSPIGGEDPREVTWRAAVAARASELRLTDVNSLALYFTLEPGRRVDLDNLVRPVLAGLRDAGWFERGFAALDQIVATKEVGLVAGVEIVPFPAASGREPGDEVHVVFKDAIPTNDKVELKRAWRDAVRDACARPPMDAPVTVELGLRTKRSIVD